MSPQDRQSGPFGPLSPVRTVAVLDVIPNPPGRPLHRGINRPCDSYAEEGNDQPASNQRGYAS